MSAASGPRSISSAPGSLERVLRDVVIAGGGFGGYYAARALERKAPPNVRITLINDVNYLCYAPLLPGGGGGSA